MSGSRFHPKVEEPETDVSSDVTERKQKPQLYRPGESGNPNGRPRGARNRLATDLLEAFANDFSEHGVEAIVKMRQTDNSAYVKTAVNILPREVLVAAFNVNVGSAFADYNMRDPQQFLEAYRLAKSMIGASPPEIELEADVEIADD